MFRDLSLVQRMDVIGEVCAGKRVLHLGCTNFPYTEESIRDGMLLHFALEKTAGELWGLDSDAEGLEIMRSHGSTNLIHADLEHLAEVEMPKPPEIIIAGEMIEHLDNPGLFLGGLRGLMTAETRVVLTTINAYCGVRFAWYGLRGKGGCNEPVHPDHVAYYSYSTLRLLVERHGLQVDTFLFYDIGREHRPHNRWYYNALNDVIVRMAPQLADGLIAICRLKQAAID